jgi:peptidoglycan/LPS O-acetylase OafA/YrhL
MDGLRGVAALAVMLCHSWPDGGPVQNGPLAVDFFFLLSGFVIAHAYEDALRAGLTVPAFMIRRLIRLYPLIALGAGGGFAIALVHTLAHGATAPPLAAVIASGLLSLCVLPYFGPGLGPNAFSFDPPLWSLSFELLAYWAYAMLARRLASGGLVLIVLAGLAGTIAGGPLGGGDQAGFWLGLPRVACGFFGGVLLHRLHEAGRLPRLAGTFPVLAIALLSLFCCPWVIGGWLFVPAFAVFGLIVTGAAGARAGRLDGVCTALGVMSYALYVLHWQTLLIARAITERLGFGATLPTSAALLHALIVPFIAYAAARWYDAPLRRIITRHDRDIDRATATPLRNDRPRILPPARAGAARYNDETTSIK